MALIHVIIPVYNAKQYLEETVESILKQPNDDIDILLIDDGSTDGSSELCDEFTKKNKRIFAIHQKNSGVSIARNTGIEYVLNHSTEENEFCMFLDADDLWHRNVITGDLLKRIQENKDVDVYVFGSTCSNEMGDSFSYPRLYEEKCVEGGNGVIWKMQGTFGANLYHISLFKKWGIRFREGLKYSEDKIFMIQCAFLARKVQFMSQMLYIYRQNAYSAMNRSLKISPKEYYLPIIDGWISSDLFLNGLRDVTYKSTDAGFVLASIYFGDMASEHYKRWGSPRELQEIREHPYYCLFENMNPNCVTKKQFADHNLLLNHPVLYRVKYNVIGMIEFSIRMLLKWKPVHDYRNKKKYPLHIQDFD